MMRLGMQRLWGGIHIEPGDFVGRRLGRQVGLAAVERTKSFFAGTVAPMPRDAGEASAGSSWQLWIEPRDESQLSCTCNTMVLAALEGVRCPARAPAWEAGAGLSGEGHHPISTGG